jgi:hypothetical protein
MPKFDVTIVTIAAAYEKVAVTNNSEAMRNDQRWSFHLRGESIEG